MGCGVQHPKVGWRLLLSGNSNTTTFFCPIMLPLLLSSSRVSRIGLTAFVNSRSSPTQWMNFLIYRLPIRE